ncbi:MAG: cytidylate kinase-like family protein [Thermoguttaceae bacterium]|nr:cytidylate kinase-like family protein [Thermoguttaceae bacterium]MDW8079164.1 cytidylate kinase-like family protein [Thermoguttaceae bacterium]
MSSGLERQLVAQAAERQMRLHSAVEELRHHEVVVSRAKGECAGLGRYIAISREAGSGGTQVAYRVGELLGWRVLDRNLLDAMAERSRTPREMLELVDDGYPGWFFEAFGCWFNRRLVTRARYLVYLKSVLREMLREQNLVIVGRGAQFLLPRECGLAVRIIASEPYRIDQMRKRHGLSYEQARAMIRRLDDERTRFIRQTFGRDSQNPYLYDLVINVERTGIDGAAEVIASAAEQLLFKKR